MLKPDTERVWRFLRQQPLLSGFSLVGGSALALRLKHRLSEDLDFAFPGTKLPRARLDALRESARQQGFRFEPNDDPAAVIEFEDSPLDLLDHHQDHLVDGIVKVSFFVPNAAHAKLFRAGGKRAGARVATLQELFGTKCLLTADRSKSRDWLDLYALFRERGFTMERFREAFVRAGVPQSYEPGINRLCAARRVASDEGFESLMDNPPSLEEIGRYFTSARDRYERRLAAAVARPHST